MMRITDCGAKVLFLLHFRRMLLIRPIYNINVQIYPKHRQDFLVLEFTDPQQLAVGRGAMVPQPHPSKANPFGCSRALGGVARLQPFCQLHRFTCLITGVRIHFGLLSFYRSEIIKLGIFSLKSFCLFFSPQLYCSGFFFEQLTLVELCTLIESGIDQLFQIKWLLSITI